MHVGSTTAVAAQAAFIFVINSLAVGVQRQDSKTALN